MPNMKNRDKTFQTLKINFEKSKCSSKTHRKSKTPTKTKQKMKFTTVETLVADLYVKQWGEKMFRFSTESPTLTRNKTSLLFEFANTKCY